MTMNHRPGTRGKDRGSILLIALLLTSAMTLLAASVTGTIRGRLETSGGEQRAFKADMAIHSALGYSLKQLQLDADWDGTNGPVELDDKTAFTVSRRESSNGDGTFSLILSSSLNEAARQVEVILDDKDGGVPLGEQALAMLGGGADLKHLNIEGNVIFTDALNSVYDYRPHPTDPDGGSWELGGADSLASFEFKHTDVQGTVSQYSGTDYGFETTFTATDPVYAPAWHLEEYLEPGPDRVHYTGLSMLKDVVLEETAVFILAPGDSVTIWNCELRGGMVVYTAPTFDPRSGYQNEIVLKKTNIIGGGSQGMHENIGLIAPATKVRSMGNNGHPPTFIGFSYVNSLHQVMGGTINGQMVVINEVDHFMHTDIFFNRSVTENLPDGVGYGDSASSMKVVTIREVYDAD